MSQSTSTQTPNQPKNNENQLEGKPISEFLFNLNPKKKYFHLENISSSPRQLYSLPLPRQKHQFSILVSNLDQLMYKMCAISLSGTFDHDERAILSTISLRSELLNAIRNVTGIDYHIPPFNFLYVARTNEPQAKLCEKYLGELRNRLLKQLRTFRGLNEIITSILKSNIVNADQVAQHIMNFLSIRYFEKGYVWQQYNEKAAQRNFDDKERWITLNGLPIDTVTMQSVTCTNISFAPSRPKNNPPKKRKPTIKEQRELKRIEIAATKAMNMRKEYRAMREVYNDLDLPHMQGESSTSKFVSRAASLIEESKTQISEEDKAAVEAALSEASVWTKVTDFIKLCASAPGNFVSSMIAYSTKAFGLFNDLWSFVKSFMSSARSGMELVTGAIQTWETLKTLFICAIIIIIAHKTGNSSIGLLIAGFYISYDITRRATDQSPAGWIMNKVSNLISSCDASDATTTPKMQGPTTSVSEVIVHLITLSAISFFSIPSLLVNEDQYTSLFTKVCAKAFNMALVQSLASRMKSAFAWITELICTDILGFAPNFENFVPKDIDDYIAEVHHFYCFEIKNFRTDEKACQRLKQLYMSIPILLKKYNDIRKLKNLITDHCAFIFRTYSEASLLNPALITARNEPVTIALRGDAGVGKTKLIQKLAVLAVIEAGLIKTGMPDPEMSKVIAQNIYARRADNKYWDGYTNQVVTVYDDFGQLTETTSSPNLEYIEIIGLGNTFQMPLTMAHLTNKGNVFFDSKMLILTTNCKTLNPVSLNHAEALHRRIDFAYEVRLKENIDKRKFLASNNIEQDVHDFYTWCPKTGACGVVAYSFSQVCDSIKKRFEHIRNKNLAELNDTTTFAKAMVAAVNDNVVMNAPNEPAPSSSASDYQQASDTKDVKNMTSEELAKYIHELSAIHNKVVEAETKDVPIRDQLPSSVRAVIYPFKTVGEYLIDMAKKAGNDLTEISSLYWRYSKYCYHSLMYYVLRGQDVIKEDASITPIDKSSIVSLSSFVKENVNLFKKIVYEWKLPIIISGIALVMMFFRLDKQIIKAFQYLANSKVGAVAGAAVAATGIVAAKTKTVVYYITGKAADLLTAFYESGKTFMQSLSEAWYGTEEELPDWYDDWVQFYWENRARMMSELGYQDPLEEDESRDLICALWLLFRKTPRMQSGKARTHSKKTTKKPTVSKADTVVMNAWNNDNANQISRKVISNSRMITFNGTYYNIFMIRKTWFVMNKHVYQVLLDLTSGSRNVDICNNACDLGTTISFADIEWKHCEDRNLDLIFGKLPSRVFSQAPDLVPHIMKKHEIEDLQGKSAVLLIPSPAGATQKFGVIESVVMQEMKHPEGHQVKMQTIEVRTKTAPGDCGGVYMVDAADNRKIFGIHTAGAQIATRAFATPLYQEMFDDVIMQSETIASEEEHIPPPMIQQGNGNVTFLGYKPAAFNPVKSQIVKTQVHNKIFPSTCAPAKLGKFNDPNGPMLKALEKQFGPVASVNDKILAVAADNYVRKLEESFPRPLTVFSFATATQGREGTEYVRGINRSRSAGYPYCLQAKGKGKTDWFGKDEWVFNEKTAELKDIIEKQIAEMEQGIVQEYIFMDTLKDETRPIEKVAAGKTRVFAAAPMDFIIVFRMYFLDFLVYMMENRIFNESAVGIRAQSDEWTVLRNKLKIKGNRVVAGDFSNYDGTLHPKILWAVYDVIDGFYDLYGATQKEKQVRECLWHNIVNSYHLCGNWFYQLNHSQPSGNPSTAILNSMYNSIACRYTFYTIYSEDTDFNEYVSMIAYGDDNILNISSRVPDFNQESMAAAFYEIGMTYTDEMKTGVLADKTLDEVAFLKRSFIYDYSRMFCFAPLSLPSILEAFNWIKKTDCEPEVLKQIADNALVELSMHPIDTFLEYAEKIKNAFAKTYNIHVHVSSYQFYRLKIVAGTIYNSHPTLDWA